MGLSFIDYATMNYCNCSWVQLQAHISNRNDLATEDQSEQNMVTDGHLLAQ